MRLAKRKKRLRRMTAVNSTCKHIVIILEIFLAFFVIC